MFTPAVLTQATVHDVCAMPRKATELMEPIGHLVDVDNAVAAHGYELGAVGADVNVQHAAPADSRAGVTPVLMRFEYCYVVTRGVVPDVHDDLSCEPG